MFEPPRCPYRHCREHKALSPGALRPWGSYQPKCRAHPVPRFRCTSCERTFSRQSFRMDFRDHRPDLNARLFEFLISGAGLRQSSRILKLSLRCTELKFRKLARHLRRLNLNLQAELSPKSILQFDEFETFEGTRVVRPLTIAFLIEKETRFLVWAESARIPVRSRRSKKRKALKLSPEEQRRRKADGSRSGIERTLRRGAALTSAAASVQLETDKKSSYVTLGKQVFGEARLKHSRTSSRLVRDEKNPLFAINQAEAMARDLLGRLRRDSWLASKKRRYLDLALAMYASWRNLVRLRFNKDEESAAQLLGFLPRRLSIQEILSWRQEWRERSIHPLASGSQSISEWRSTRSAGVSA